MFMRPRPIDPENITVLLENGEPHAFLHCVPGRAESLVTCPSTAKRFLDAYPHVKREELPSRRLAITYGLDHKSVPENEWMLR